MGKRWNQSTKIRDGTCANLVLDDTKTFMVNEDFQAANVTLKRSVNAGYNTMCQPFWVSKEDMKAASIATYKEIVDKEDNNSVVTFEKADHVDANVPFIANYNEAVPEFTFTDKGVVNTNNGLGTTFVGNYIPGNVEGKYNLLPTVPSRKAMQKLLPMLSVPTWSCQKVTKQRLSL